MSKNVSKSLGRLGILGTLGLLFPAALYAQMSSDEGAAAAGIVAFIAAFFLVFLVIFGVVYVYTSLALQTIAKKTNTENGWLAWIPIINFYLMLTIAKKPAWWLIFLIPPLFLALIVIMPLTWMGIAEARQKPSWWGILVIVPVVHLIVPGYLAWSD